MPRGPIGRRRPVWSSSPLIAARGNMSCYLKDSTRAWHTFHRRRKGGPTQQNPSRGTPSTDIYINIYRKGGNAGGGRRAGGGQAGRLARQSRNPHGHAPRMEARILIADERLRAEGQRGPSTSEVQRGRAGGKRGERAIAGRQAGLSGNHLPRQREVALNPE